jgi:uncharacterized repeat protein (TIGR01451 family)
MTNVNVHNKGIANITGLQYFDSLKSLNVGNGQYLMLYPNTLTSLPRLPSTLDTLICSDNQLTNLPTLPNSLRYLECVANTLTTLPALPNSIEILNFSDNNLSFLPVLPNNLKILNCYLNQLTYLPSLPSSLTELNCNRNQLSTLPTLPNSLVTIFCGSNQINILPTLPTSLNLFDCSSNNLTTLPTLPSSLHYLLNCSYNQITNIPTLPDSLHYLFCQHNQLSSLPLLSDSLFYLYCENNNITSLPSLPNTIDRLNCSNNQLVNLPVLPNSLQQLGCSSNSLIILPPLPSNLGYLNCSNNLLTNLPTLPNTIYELDCSSNNINCFAPFNYISWKCNISNNPFSCLPNYIQAMDDSILNYPLCLPGNIHSCQNAEGVFGYIYKDNNNDCLNNIGDFKLKNIPLKIFDSTNNLLSQTNSNVSGLYHFQQTANTYSIKVDTLLLPFTTSCLYPGLDSTVTVATLDTNINFALTCKSGFDVGVQSISTNGIIFPGQNHVLNVNAGDITHWYNLNCASGTSGTLSFSVNGPVTYIGSAAGAINPIVTGNVYTYNITDFGTINNSTDFQLLFQTNTTAQAGDVICVNATVTPISGDNNPINNTYTFCYNVVNSYDPNIKETYPENVQPGFNDWITYTIHFQNTGNAPAFNIRIQDELDTMLNLETFQVINYSHQNLVDLTGSVLNVRFPNIQLPDSTTNSTGSKGFIQYRVKPKATWASPYQIKNTAYIYFDYNAPIVTNTTLNTILIPTGLKNQTETVMNLYPNPSNGNFTIELNTKEKQFIQIFDITGNVVISQTIENGKAIIDGSNLAAGIYNINIKGNNSVANKKLVIVK